MDSNRFDTWTRTRATTTNRRSVLGWSLTAGVAAALSRFQPANAQFGGGGNGSCTYTVTLTSSFDASQTASGTLVIDVGNEGVIDTGSLTLNGQGAASVVGHATGAAVDLLVALSDGTTLALTGVASGPIRNCSTPLVGYLANPDTGQLGTWQTSSGAGSGSGSTAPAAQVATSGQTSSGQTNTGQSASGQTNTNPPPAQSQCPAPSFPCGPNCAPAGGICLDANTGAFTCPDGTIQCGFSCFPACTDENDFFNADTCQCESAGQPGGGACLELHSQCNASAECCSGWCTDNECRSCGNTICGEDCIVLSDNLAHCGMCFNPCNTDTQSCVNGVCTDDNGG